MKRAVLACSTVAVLGLSGCTLQEVATKNRVGVEWVHDGGQATDSYRYWVQPGFECKWSNGVATGISYRRRDVDDGSGGNDQGVFFDFAIPLWKASTKRDVLAQRVAALEAKLAVQTEAKPPTEVNP